jgi:hypothetical protein
MATFSLGTSGITPGAPGVFINEQPGRLANADLASFSTVYMLVEAEENVPSTGNFLPFNTPVSITSLADYRARIGGIVPTSRIPLLSYNCVNEFFQNAQVGDLRVVRVGTPNQIVELEFFPSGTKINSTSAPSALMAGNVVYVQMVINGLRLVSGLDDTFHQAHPGYTAEGEYLGVPVEIPVNYVAGDEVNNRKISAAIATAVRNAIESNPSVRSSVYVRDFGLLNDLDPLNNANSENSAVVIASTTFDGNVSVVTQVFPIGTNFVFMQNTYEVQNIVGESTNLERVPQDYTQTISTAFDGVQDQGYLITPTAYAQFDAAGRALVGAAAAAHCESNNFKWMALADPGPFLITDVNKYSNFSEHQAAADLVTGMKYLVDNAIYEWTGTGISPVKLSYQTIVYGQSAEVAINESANLVADERQVGLLDAGEYTITSGLTAVDGIFTLDTDQYWPVTLPIQLVTLSNANNVGNDFLAAQVQGQGATTFNLNGTEVYLVAPPANVAVSGSYSLNNVFLTVSAADASAVFNEVVLAGGSDFITSPPNGAVYTVGSGSTGLVSYADAYWDLPVTVNGQTSDLIENISGADAGVNTLHFPGTLQSPTETYRFNWVNRTIFNASVSIAGYSGPNTTYTGAAVVTALSHGLRSGQVIYFTQPVVQTNGSLSNSLFKQTTKLVSNPYYVSVISTDTFALANSLDNYTIQSWVGIQAGYTISALPTIFYSRILGGGLTTVTPYELLTLPTQRGRKYAFDTSSIFNQAAAAAVTPAGDVASNPRSSIYLNNSSLILGTEQINPYGEDLTSLTQCGWLPKFNLIDPDTAPVAATNNAFCAPTVDQFFQPEAFFVPTIDGINGGSYNPAGTSTLGPIATLNAGSRTGGTGGSAGNYTIAVTSSGLGTGATVNFTVGNTAAVGPIATLGAPTAGVAALQTFNAPTFNINAVPTTSSTVGSGATLNVTISPVAATAVVTGLGTFATTTPDPSQTFTNITTITAPSGGTGLDLSFDTNVSGDIISGTVVVNAGGSGYTYGETVTITAGAGLYTAVITNASADGVASAVALNAAGTGYNTTAVLQIAAGDLAGISGVTVPVATVTLPVGITTVTVNNPGINYAALETLTIPANAAGSGITLATIQVATVTAGPGVFSAVTPYATASGLLTGSSAADAQQILSRLTGVYFSVTANGTAPDGVTPVVANGFMAGAYNGSTYSWVAIAPLAEGGDLTSIGQVCYGSQVEVTLSPEQTPPSSLWRFDAITSTEIIDNALRGVGFNGVPQAVFVEAGVDNVNRLYDDSQRYFNPFGFIAYYGPYVENGAGQFIPPSPYVTGVAVRRYRAEGYQFPPAGVKYQLADAVAAQIPINSAQQNLLNPAGCNAIRTLPGYPQTAVFIWGGRTRVNTNDAQQKLYQFVNTRVILNVVYGSLRTAFDSQIFNVIDGFGVIFNQIISVGNSILNQLYVRGALFGARPSDAFQVICDGRINPPEDIENGIVNAKVFVTPVPTLERIQIDLIRVAIGKMQQELDIQGLGNTNAAGINNPTAGLN